MTSSIWLRSERSDYPWLIHHTLSAVDAGPARKCVLGFAVFVTLLTATSVFIIAFICRNAGHVLGRYRMVHVVVPVPRPELSTDNVFNLWIAGSFLATQRLHVVPEFISGSCTCELGSLRGLAFKMSLVRSIPSSLG